MEEVNISINKKWLICCFIVNKNDKSLGCMVFPIFGHGRKPMYKQKLIGRCRDQCLQQKPAVLPANHAPTFTRPHLYSLAQLGFMRHHFNPCSIPTAKALTYGSQ